MEKDCNLYIQHPKTTNIGIVTAHGNTGSIHLRINCRVAVQATQVDCTGGHHYGFYLEFIGESTNCKSQVIFHMSHSYFGRNTVGALLKFVSITCFVRVEVENITLGKIIAKH